MLPSVRPFAYSAYAAKKIGLAFARGEGRTARPGHPAVSSPTSASEAVPITDQRSAGWFSEQIQVHDAALKFYLHQSFPTARAEVDDVVQESYLRVWKACAHQPLLSARAFLFKVARHVALDFVRRHRASPVRVVGDVSALPVLDEKRGVVETVSVDEKVRLLVEGLATLPVRGREVVMLRKFKGLSQK